jgi:aspartyl-tRNA(Asn)/glutamyl-tRNA(Gln) amidotransferase subunit A
VTSFALGTDGGGSIRVPASLTGTFGFKGNFGRVPVWPTAATPTLAHVCPLARNVRDAALLLQAIAGYDSRDPGAIAGAVPDFLAACEASPKGLRVAWSPTLGYATPDPEVVRVCEQAARRLEQASCIVEEVDRVFAADPEDIWTAEFYAGVGTRLRSILETIRDLLDPAVAEILDAALAQDMRAYYETVFRRYTLRDDMVAFMARYDLLLSPTLPIDALEAGRNIPAGLEGRNLVSWVYYTYPFNLTGQPAASLPVGLSSRGRPVGLQIVGARNDEISVLKTAAWLERELASV